MQPSLLPFFAESCYNPVYKDQWITDPMTVAMIRDVDRSEVIGDQLIQSPVPGAIDIPVSRRFETHI